MNIITNAFAGILDSFLSMDSIDGISSYGGWFGWGKNKIVKNKLITPRNRRVRATSQVKFSHDNYFKIGNYLNRAKSKEFRNRNIGRIKKEDSKDSGGKNIEIDPLGKPPSSERSVRKGMIMKRPDNSNEIVTAHSSKPQSHLQSDKKWNKRKNSSKKYPLPPQVITAKMDDLKCVKEEFESVVAENNFPNEEGLEIKQLESVNELEDNSELSGHVMKNNFLMKTHPIGSFKTLEVENVWKDNNQILNKNLDKSKTFPLKESKLEEIKNINSKIEDWRKRINIENQQLKLTKFEETQLINNNFEITSNGMVKMKQKEPKYFKIRYKKDKKIEE